jgi:hypothetical protein
MVLVGTIVVTKGTTIIYEGQFISRCLRFSRVCASRWFLLQFISQCLGFSRVCASRWFLFRHPLRLSDLYLVAF